MQIHDDVQFDSIMLCYLRTVSPDAAGSLGASLASRAGSIRHDRSSTALKAATTTPPQRRRSMPIAHFTPDDSDYDEEVLRRQVRLSVGSTPTRLSLGEPVNRRSSAKKHIIEHLVRIAVLLCCACCMR